MALGTRIDCSSLETLEGFDDYLRKLRAATQYNESLLEECGKEICGAIWGQSNPDISGIGVSIGYAIGLALGLIFAAVFLGIRQRKGSSWEFSQLVCLAGFEAFFSSAIYFGIALEIASIYTLVNKDFGISTAGLGASEAEIVMAVSVVCILPLLYPIALLPTRLHHPESERQKPPKSGNDVSVKQDNCRLMLFSLLCILFFYPFLSQCIHQWAPSRVGEGNGTEGETIVTIEEWNKIEALCFNSIKRLSASESKLMAGFELASSIVIYCFTIWCGLGVGARTLATQDREFGEERRITRVLLKSQRWVERLWKTYSGVRVVLILIPAVLGVPLLWYVFRLREIQSAALDRLGVEYTGNEWGFGQVVGIVIFAPVVTDMVFAAWAARSLLSG
ncbi:hypothetical protein CKAH01_00362 [Colletotrichum kahawae]|uniref:Uncharacterized protein n=1 Tax=Colletotrichum kahawae TaxID=34407 RepID=A0AAE0DD17_COLKA|nr:hypothetical protein CKAH01_00362 [Colletotrichum kahawae]